MDGKRLAELEALRPKAILYVRKHCGGPSGLNYQDAEDVVSDVIVKLWQDGREVTPALFFTACKNRAVDVIREGKAEKRQAVEMRGEATSEERQELRSLLSEILAGLNLLDDGRRRAVELRLLGYGEQELAATLGCTISASKKRVHRGICDLRTAGVGT